MLMATTVIPALPLAQIFFTGLVPLLGHMMRIGVSSFFAFIPLQKIQKILVITQNLVEFIKCPI